MEEEELMEECLEAMLEEERQHQRNQTSSAWCNAANAENNGAELCQQLNSLRVHDNIAQQVSSYFFYFKLIHKFFIKIYSKYLCAENLRLNISVETLRIFHSWNLKLLCFTMLMTLF